MKTIHLASFLLGNFLILIDIKDVSLHIFRLSSSTLCFAVSDSHYQFFHPLARLSKSHWVLTKMLGLVLAHLCALRIHCRPSGQTLLEGQDLRHWTACSILAPQHRTVTWMISVTEKLFLRAIENVYDCWCQAEEQCPLGAGNLVLKKKKMFYGLHKTQFTLGCWLLLWRCAIRIQPASIFTPDLWSHHLILFVHFIYIFIQVDVQASYASFIHIVFQVINGLVWGVGLLTGLFPTPQSYCFGTSHCMLISSSIMYCFYKTWPLSQHWI